MPRWCECTCRYTRALGRAAPRHQHHRCFHNIRTHFLLCRSEDFQPVYGCLHEIRAPVPTGVPYLAWTTTVTRSIRDEVIWSLNMVDYQYIRLLIARLIKCHLQSSPSFRCWDWHAACAFVFERLPEKSSTSAVAPWTGVLYAHFHFESGDCSYYPARAEQN